jgi:predicted histone-like DNA-binding protein
MINYFVQERKSPKTGTVKYYATAGRVTPLKLATIAEAISKECTVTVHDVKAVLSALEEKMINAFQNGQSVRFGDLGSFRVTLHSEGQDEKSKVSADAIKSVHVCFRKSAAMSNALEVKNPNVNFRLIAKNTGKVTA